MNPLSTLFGTAVRIRNKLYDRGMIPVHRLQGPVVSIGNLTVGGSGKTPFLILLGDLLKRRGVRFDVLSRGYRRRASGVALVDPQGAADEFGDEPLLIARKLGVPVIVGEDRYAAGKFAEEKFGPQLHLLDDGFQHRRLARDFDIVMLGSNDGRDSLLPIGRLREPASSLGRADVIILTNEASAEELGLQQHHVWRIRRGIMAPETSQPCFAFCGIARPNKFFAQLRQAGITVTGTRSFRDHHAYDDADVRQLLELRKQCAAAAFVTTEKDAVNLAPHLLAMQPVYVVPVHMELEHADAAVDSLLAAITARKQCAT